MFDLELRLKQCKGHLFRRLFIPIFFTYDWRMEFKESEVVLFHGVVDLRKGAPGLLGLVDNPKSGVWYLFSNRSRSLLKCVRLDRRGIWMGSRRLKHGTYCWLERSCGSSQLSADAFRELCDGKKPKVFD